jgi:uncharacterized membrane protein
MQWCGSFLEPCISPMIDKTAPRTALPHLPAPLRRFLASFTGIGLMLGALFFAASLTPSLVPRHPAVQGALSGVCFAAGYGLGVIFQWAWHALQLRGPGGRAVALGRLAAIGACALIAALALWKAQGWQDGLRALMKMPPTDGAHWLTLISVALIVALIFLMLGRLFVWLLGLLAVKFRRVMPGPVAMIAAILATATLFYAIGDGVLVKAAMTAFDRTYARLDALIDPEIPAPTDPSRTGSPASLMKWAGLGRMGRAFISGEPDAAKIAAMTGGPATQPLRVYAGLNSADTPEERARLALAELIRIGGFSRGTLALVTPTGTGWVDPESQTALEYLTRGDVASVAVQYSYLASWLALLTQPEYGAETARAVFDAIYGHWRSLPKESRPRLYLHGLSLGAFNSDLSHDLFQVIADPYHGAFWTGPPFPSRTWTRVTAQRNPGTPAWLPEFRDGSVIRFTSQENRLDRATAQFGPYRIVYLQYASDAVSFFDPGALWRRPAWLTGPLGPDVSPDFRWLPVVTFLQLSIDIMLATQTPLGYGHVYAFQHYLDGWAGLMEVPGWTPESLAALKAKVAKAR